MIEFHGINGKVAKVMIDNIDESSAKQIQSIINHPAFNEGCVFMPDVHAGKGCAIGFTQKLENNIVPNLIGVDIGCGMWTAEFPRVDIDLPRFDRYVKQNIPMGMSVRNDKVKVNDEFYEKVKIVLERIGKKEVIDRAIYSIGTLGGGNHFYSLDAESPTSSTIFSTVHTGSRNFGKLIAEFYQKKAVEFCGGAHRPKNCSGYGFHMGISEDQAYLPIEYGGDEYIEAMKVAQEYASLNRKAIQDIVERYLQDVHGVSYIDSYECIHNYINFKDNIIRKGAISAHKGEKLIVPLNMRDGILLGVGKGNPEWNYSSPHGAGRLMSRSQAKKNITLKDFKDSMKGIYSSSIGQDTLDESPFAYKDSQMIIDAVKDTMEITKIISPIYNVKSGKE